MDALIVAPQASASAATSMTFSGWSLDNWTLDDWSLQSGLYVSAGVSIGLGARPTATATAIAILPSVNNATNSSIVAQSAMSVAFARVPSTGSGTIISEAASASAVVETPAAVGDGSRVTFAPVPARATSIARPPTMLSFSSFIAAPPALSGSSAGPAFATSFADSGSTFKQIWTALIVNPDGTEFIINPLADVSINETFDKVTADVQVPWNASGLPMVTDLVSDIVLIRGKVKMCRLRVLDSEDILNRESHTVQLTCCSYEEILRTGRILYEDAEMTGDQLELAWDIVESTQARQSLGITRYLTPVGTTQTVQLLAGMTITEAIDSFAASDDGFDWWIDVNLMFHTQEPRRESLIDYEWTWGAEVAELTRSSSVEEYASAVRVTGATAEVTIPGGGTYPPPAPAVREIADMPYGRWEKVFAYSNIVTNASLVRRADWHLGVGSRMRPSYSIILEQGVWSPSVQLGGIVSLRVQSNNRLSFKVPARIEEMTIQINGDGAEIVSMMLRAESEELQIGTVMNAEVIAVNTPPVGSTVITSPEPSGLSKTVRRISAVDGLANVISSLAERLKRQERP